MWLVYLTIIYSKYYFICIAMCLLIDPTSDWISQDHKCSDKFGKCLERPVSRIPNTGNSILFRWINQWKRAGSLDIHWTSRSILLFHLIRNPWKRNVILFTASPALFFLSLLPSLRIGLRNSRMNATSLIWYSRLSGGVLNV